MPTRDLRVGEHDRGMVAVSNFAFGNRRSTLVAAIIPMRFAAWVSCRRAVTSPAA